MAREQHDYRMGWFVLEAGAAILIAITALTGHRL
jgi:hypothetical protein